MRLSRQFAVVNEDHASRDVRTPITRNGDLTGGPRNDDLAPGQAGVSPCTTRSTGDRDRETAASKSGRRAFGRLLRVPTRPARSRLRWQTMGKVGQWFCKHEAPSGETTPLHDSSLQRPQLAGGEFTGALAAEPLKEFFGRPIGFRLEPGHHPWPRRLEGIAASAPVSRRLES